MRRAHSWRAHGNFLGEFSFLPLFFGVDSTPGMAEWVGGWDGAIWDGFSS